MEREMLAPGIVVYRDVFKKEMDLVNRLEDAIGSQKSLKYKWNQASTGYANTDLSYRDCVDFKIKVNFSRQRNCVSFDIEILKSNLFGK